MSRVARVLVVALAAATPVLPAHWAAAPASAATCVAGGGVSVVVDFNSLGGGVRTSCVPGGGGDKASAIITAAGHELTRVQRQPGFVCRVDSVPADDPCVNTPPADAFWGLWWSNGTSGTWTYSSLGVDSLTIPDGGSVAFSWDDVDGSDPPSAAPPKTSASPSASPTGSGAAGASGAGTGTGTGTGTGNGAGGGAGSGGVGASAPAGTLSPSGAASSTAASTGADPSRAREREARQRKRAGRDDATPGPDPSATVDGVPDAADESDPAPDPAAAPDADGGLPIWVAPVALLVLALGAGGAVLLRRRSTS